MDKIKQDIVEPFRIVEHGLCGECMTPLSIISHELNVSILDKNGLPIKHENVFNKEYGICTRCGKRYKMLKTGFGYEKYSYVGEKYQEFIQKNLSNNDKALRDKNPFAKIIRRYKNVRELNDSNE